MSCRERASARATGTPKPKPTRRRAASPKSLRPFPLQRRSIMFEKISQAAETLATHVSVSRRGFLGRLGQGALVAAGAVGGLLLLSGDVRADQTNCCPWKKCPPGKFCVSYCK